MDSLLHIFDLATITSVFAEFRSESHHSAFWLAVGKIIWINVLLSGDNALVIALACRGLAPPQRLWAWSSEPQPQSFSALSLRGLSQP